MLEAQKARKGQEGYHQIGDQQHWVGWGVGGWHALTYPLLFQTTALPRKHPWRPHIFIPQRDKRGQRGKGLGSSLREGL